MSKESKGVGSVKDIMIIKFYFDGAKDENVSKQFYLEKTAFLMFVIN